MLARAIRQLEMVQEMQRQIVEELLREAGHRGGEQIGTPAHNVQPMTTTKALQQEPPR